MKCDKCGTKFEGNFCTNCGTPSTKAETATKASDPEQNTQQAPVPQKPTYNNVPVPQQPTYNNAPMPQQPQYNPPMPQQQKKKNNGLIIGIIVAAVVVVLILAISFGGSDGDSDASESGTSPTVSTNADTVPEVTASQKETQAPVAEQVLYEQNGIKVTFKGLDEKSSYMGPSIKLLIENNSGKSYTVQARDLSVNGFMVDPIFSCEVAAGKAANDEMTIMSSDIEKNNITDINEVEFSFHIFNSETWSDSVDSEKITIKF